ncbi:MAG: CpaF family protein [Planctomyces sp.]|nr:CpaF family protein [Planctomyces sp.]
MFTTDAPLSRPADPGSRKESREQRFLRIKQDIHKHLIAAMDLSSANALNDYDLRRELRRGLEDLCRSRADLLSETDRLRMINEVIDETLGLGPIEPLLRDPTITDILINGPKTVYVERRGRLERTNVAFHDEDHLVEIVQRIAGKIGRRLDEASPMVDARLADGSRVNAVIRPLAIDGALVSIRRFSAKPLIAGDLIARGSVAKEMIEFLIACVQSRLNIIVSGGTGSGKSTLLNILSGFISEHERLATIEDAAELRLQQSHVARMETRPANLEGAGEVTSRDLVRNALRMRPDRIIVGECRGEEAFDMLQAMTTGHAGSLTTIHANGTRHALRRLEMLVGMAGFDLPIWFIRELIASAVTIVVHCERMTGGQRRVTQISEVTGIVGDMVQMHDLFTFVQTGLDDEHQAQGHFMATGIRPQCLEQLQICGYQFAPAHFERKRLEFDRNEALLASAQTRRTRP